MACVISKKEENEINEIINSFCIRNSYQYSDNILNEFKFWLPTAKKSAIEKYDYKTCTYIPRCNSEIIKYWLCYCSAYIKKQQIERKLCRQQTDLKPSNDVIKKYCENNYIECDPTAPY